MLFEKIRTVPTADELLDKAYSRAVRAGRGKIKEVTDKEELEESMLLTAGNIIADNLRAIAGDWPSLDKMSGFYRELTEIIAGVDRLKMSLASLDWAASKVKEISRKYVGMMRKDPDPVKVRKQAYGRISSIVYDIDADLRFLNEARNRLNKLPDVNDEPTIVVAGYPNVGKSSFVSDVTGARPEIAQYPFTTKNITIGHFIFKRKRYQVIDTPGLLDRPLEERNDIERQAISALRHVGNAVLFIIDPSETCGYTLKEQYHLLAGVKKFVKMPVLAVANKIDIEGEKNVEADMCMSTLTGGGVTEVRDRLVEMIAAEAPKKKPEEPGVQLPPSRKKKK
ncbi:MAG TPA: NOG1 family protein [Methanocella sp.]|nr:NOG1 family protein [Methanocella sp.]